ncbi:MAG: TraB/GumN family protein, partial [Caulobacteraceae bacterium]
ASADEVWFELPIDAATRVQATTLSLRRGQLPSGRRLASMMSPTETERLRRAAVSLDCAPDALDRMQPWMADLTLSLADDARAGATASAGAEDEIEALAPATARRMAFETAREQIELLAGSPVKDQIAGLEWTVREVKDDPASYRRVVAEWMRGDLAGIQRDAIVPLVEASPTLYDRLIGARNRRWAKTLAKRLKKPGAIVVVVGIAHLVGPQGVPALLRAKGFDVEGPIFETPPEPAPTIALGSRH